MSQDQPAFFKGDKILIQNNSTFHNLQAEIKVVEERGKTFKYGVKIPLRGLFFFHDFEIRKDSKGE